MVVCVTRTSVWQREPVAERVVLTTPTQRTRAKELSARPTVIAA